MSFFQKTVLAVCAGWSLSLLAASAETDYWSDDFQVHAGSRWTTNRVWQIGSPSISIGPPVNSAGYRAYSGSHCATTGLNGVAADNTDGRLVCTNYNGTNYLTIPDAGQYPRLRFWQWFNFVNSEGYVELQQAGTTNWQTISPTNIGVGSTASYSGGVWSRPSIDMSPYAGESVQLAFHFTSGPGGWGSDPGWYVDDAALATGQPVFNDPEGFEGGLGDWAVDAGTWEVGVPTTGPPVNSKGFRAHSGTNCAATVLAGNYSENVDTRLISPAFTVPTSGSQSLSFWQWYKFINARGFVEVSSDIAVTNVNSTTNYITSTNVTDFTNVIDFTNIVYFTNLIITSETNVSMLTNVDALTNITVLSTNINNVITVSTNDWQTISPTNQSIGSDPAASTGQWTNTILDLSPFAGQTLQLAFHFQSGPSGYGNVPGWYIDDLSLVQLPTLSLPSTMVITNGQKFTVTAVATNSSLPDDLYNYTLTSPSTNAFITTNGVLEWTNARPALGTSTLSVVAADASQPALSATASLNVTVNPAYSFSFSNTLSSKQYFLLVLKSLSNTTWQIDASTDLMNWQPVFTNTVTAGGLLEYTDLLATNFPFRFYRAAYP